MRILGLGRVSRSIYSGGRSGLKQISSSVFEQASKQAIKQGQTLDHSEPGAPKLRHTKAQDSKAQARHKQGTSKQARASHEASKQQDPQIVRHIDLRPRPKPSKRSPKPCPRHHRHPSPHTRCAAPSATRLSDPTCDPSSPGTSESSTMAAQA